MYCKKCGMLLDEGAKFCKKCGSSTEYEISYKFCRTCGTKHPRDQIFCTNCGLRMDEGNAVISQKVAIQDKKISQGEIVKTFENLTYSPGEVTKLSLKIKQGNFIFKKDKIEIYKSSTGGQVVGGMLGGAIGGAIAGAIEASKISPGGGIKPSIIIPYVNIVRYVPSNIVRNKSIIFYLNDGNIYTLGFGFEANQQEALSILRKYCK